MAYATQADLVPRRMAAKDLEQLTDDTHSNTVNVQVVDEVLEEASGLVDSYCRQRYAVPLQSSQQVKGLTLDIAVYLLYSRRNRIRSASGAKDTVETNYENALQFLRDVAAGKASLDQPTNAAPQQGGGQVLATQVPEKFSDDNLKGFI